MSLIILLSVVLLAIGSIALKKTVPAMISFALMMFMLGIYYISLNEDLLGLLQIFVYTGGIVVLMLFGVTIIGSEFPDSEEKPFAILLSVGIFGSLVFILFKYFPEVNHIKNLELNGREYFVNNFADYIQIFALVGVSLIYGTVKMSSLLERKTPKNGGKKWCFILR